MIEAQHILQFLAQHIPPRTGDKCWHALQMLADGSLCVFIVDGGRWHEYRLDDADMKKTGYQIGQEILTLHRSKAS